MYPFYCFPLKGINLKFIIQELWIYLEFYADIEQILLEAQHRWLRPAEICEILLNYKNFRIAPEPPNRPPSMTFYLHLLSYNN